MPCAGELLHAYGMAVSWSYTALVAVERIYGILITSESAIVSTGIAEAAEPAYPGRTMALQSTVGITAGALAP